MNVFGQKLAIMACRWTFLSQVAPARDLCQLYNCSFRISDSRILKHNGFTSSGNYPIGTEIIEIGLVTSDKKCRQKRPFFDQKLEFLPVG